MEDLIQIRGIGEEKALALIQNAENFVFEQQQEDESATENEDLEPVPDEMNDAPDGTTTSEDETVSEALENENTDDTQEN